MNILKRAKESGRTLLEIFAQVPGSFEEYRTMIRSALKENPPTEIADADSCYIEGCVGDFPEKVIFEAYWWDKDKPSPKYYEAKVSPTDTGDVLFSEVKEIEIKAAITAKNEMQQLSESYNPDNIKMTEFNETVDATIELEPQNEAMKNRRRKGKVMTAQKADVKNENNRVYPKAVLKEATERAQKQINEFNGLLMDSQHRVDGNGNNLSDLRETVAVIKQIEFNEQTGEISLPEIEFVETQAGKDIAALLESGVKVQVSQRGHGTSHTVFDPTTNESHQQVDFLRITGVDFVPPGTASVQEATFESTNEKETSAEDGSSLTEASSEQANADGQQQRSNGAPASQPEAAKLSDEDRKRLNESEEALKRAQAKLENTEASVQASKDALDAATRSTQIAHLKEKGSEVLKAEVAQLERFNEDQKKLIIAEIKPETFFNEVSDVYSEDAIRHVLKPAIAKEAGRLDKTIATTRLDEMGFPVDQQTGRANRQNGQTRVTVLHENMPGAELHHKVLAEVNAKIEKDSERDLWVMPADHSGMKALDEVMGWFYAANYHTLLHENTLAQADIGGRIASIAAMVIGTAWRRTTAFQVIDLAPMPNRILDKKIQIQDQGDNTDMDVVTQYANLDPGENGNITQVNDSYLNYPLYATRQALRSLITPDAQATARNTPMQPMIDTVVSLAMNIRNRVDMMLWWLMIIQGLHQETGQVTTAETLTRIGTGNTWESANKAWIPLTWHKTHDANNNPLTAKFEQLTPATGESAAPTDLGTQGIELQTNANSPVALIYGTDYTIDFQQGRITLTAAGETKRSTDSVQAKYTYSKNVSVWSMTPPTGTSFSAHLLSLRRAVGQRRVAISNRNWTPNCVGFNYDIEDLITHSDRMTYLGGSPAELLDQLNQVVSYAGLEPVKSTALPAGWVPIMKKGAACHGVHTPWMFKPPITNEDTGNEYILGNQYSASDVPVNDMLGIVAVLP